jgi:transketolase
MATTDTDVRELEQRGIDVIRGMALAPLAHVLFTRIMKYDAADPTWPDRDRFVLSNGHASMLLYSLLYLTGFGLTLDDIREFRQWGAKTAGHPEYQHAPGIEVTTGPLGQGFADGVGIGLAEANLRARFGQEVVDHHTFVFCGDGDLEEGISHEAASLAGHLGLGRLIYVYDDNHITIDGATELAYTDDVPERFAAYGWHVVQLGEAANDLDALERGLREAMAETARPSMVVLRSHIGYPSPKYTDTAKAHGEALGADEVAAVKEILGLPAEDFYAPQDVIDFYRNAGTRGRDAHEAWSKRLAAFRDSEPELAAQHAACIEQRGLEGWESTLPVWKEGEEIATRAACGKIVNAVLDVVPGLIVGSADLTGNTGMALDDAPVISRHEFGGRGVHYGIREHGMGGVMNGMAVSFLMPAGGTFFVFSDYMRGAVRLAALSQYKSLFVWTHDSVGLGEDGPTHQPIEQLAAMRAMPGLRVIRPADANEVSHAWRVHVDGEGPTALVLTRQKLPVLGATADRAPEGVPRGAYSLVDEEGDGLDVVLVGTGSEVSLCVDALDLLDGLSVRVVSMPSWDLFAAQPDEYREQVLPADVPTLAVEAAATFGWERYADDVIGIDRFGASAPGPVALEHFGFTPEHVATRARALVENGAA